MDDNKSVAIREVGKGQLPFAEDWNAIARYHNEGNFSASAVSAAPVYGVAGSSIAAWNVVAPTWDGTGTSPRNETIQIPVGAITRFQSFSLFTTGGTSGTELHLTPIVEGQVYRLEVNTSSSVPFIIGAPCGVGENSTKVTSGAGGFTCLSDTWTENSKTYVWAQASAMAKVCGFELTAAATGSGLIACRLTDPTGTPYDSLLTSQIYNWQGLLSAPNSAAIGFAGVMRWYSGVWIFQQSPCVP